MPSMSASFPQATLGTRSKNYSERPDSSWQISNFIPTTNGVNNSPTLIKRELSTSVGVKSNDVLVLGGLDEDKRTEDRKGLSWLPDWLGSSGKTESKTEVLLILQATKI